MIQIKDLRPANDTADAIRDALDRIAVERAATLLAISAAKDARADALVEGTQADITKAEENRRRLELHIEQLDAMQARFHPQLDAAEAAEACADYDTAMTRLSQKKQLCAAWANGRYLEIVAEFQAYFALELEVAHAAIRIADMPAARRKLRPNSIGHVAFGMPQAYLRGDIPGLPFSFAIKLPNIEKGAPLWLQEHHPLVPANLYQFR